ncbi:MAG TPA: trypsin-like peptidase domain-containing protein [Bellilinea sp.]|nr:trypsin-like peptidase domain-containing protein [Bellilinea sp.]
MKQIFKLILLLLGIAPLLGCAAFTYSAQKVEAPTQQLAPIGSQLTPVPEQASANTSQNEENLLVDLYRSSSPSVVNITVYQQAQQGIVPVGTGSGFVFDDKGRIVTNAHVVQDADQIDVTFSDGQIQSAETIGIDQNSDLAVIQVEKVPDKVLPLPLGNMQELAVGQTVVAIGNPFGLDGTLTKGIISALGRTIPALTPFSIPEAIQTDAAINPGNSGGPLLDLHGHIIGINAQIETNGLSQSNSGVGFAIPVNIVNQVVPELISKGKYEWSWLGVRGGDVNPSLVEAMNLPIATGAYLVEVTPGGPAEQAGIRGADKQKLVNGRAVEVGGDLVIAIDGKSIDTFNDLLVYIALETRPGQTVTLTIVRNGKESDIDLLIGSRPETVE